MKRRQKSGVLRTGGGRALAQEADEGLAALLEDLGGVHCEGCDRCGGGGSGDKVTERVRRVECAEVGALGVLLESGFQKTAVQ